MPRHENSTSFKIQMLTTERVGRLTVLRPTGIKDAWNNHLWECLCDCGKRKLISFTKLSRGAIKSCGCAVFDRRATSHVSELPEYHIWANAVWRVRKGIVIRGKLRYVGLDVDPRWKKFDNFYADMGSRPTPFHSIDRIDNTRGYYPDNCRWATREEQSCNRGAYNVRVTRDGITKTVSEWIRELSLTPNAYNRARKGLPLT